MTGLALLLSLGLLQQGAGPVILLGVDRDRVSPGEVVTLTISVTSPGTDPIAIDLPGLGGFGLESRSERSDVAAGNGGGRTTVIELRLRADNPGEWRLGPVTARQGSARTRSDAVVLTITAGGSSAVAAALPERVARLVQRAPPPEALGEAGISVALSDGVAVVGQQVDVVTLAWFERGLRQRLRRAPTVESPSVDGVWSYPQPVPGGIAGSRQVNGRWYDLFLLHQVVFPLKPGRVAVSPAHLQYTVPLSLQFFSQEERYRLESAVQTLSVQPLPDEGRSPDFVGAVGRALEVSRTVVPTASRQGEALTAEVTVRGIGNVALWPPPDLRWPTGMRVYPQGADERLTMTEGRLGGAKTFKFLVMADSAGAFALPPLRYPYFDPDAGTYALATSGGHGLVVAPRAEGALSRAEPPPLRLDTARPLARRLRTALPGWAWWLVAVVLPAMHLIPPLRRRRAVTDGPARRSDPLAEAEHRLESALRAFGEGMTAAEPEDAAGRLRHAGVDPAMAERFEQVLVEVRAARYAGRSQGKGGALLARAEAVLRQLGARHPAHRRWRRRTGLLAVLWAAGLARAGLGAQTPPEELFQAGAYRAAAEGFAARAATAPDVTTHWYNLGDAAYRTGDDARALAAWTRAARLAPQDASIRRALLLVTPADQIAGRALWVAPVTPDELWCLGLAAWVAGWIGIRWGRQVRGRWVVVLGGGLALLAAGTALDIWYRRPLAIAVSNQQLRQSPHELGTAVGEVARLGTVSLGAVRGTWVLVEAAGGQRGWLRRGDLAPVAEPSP